MGAPIEVGDTVRVTFEGKVERINKIPGDESAVELKINPTNGDHTQYVSTARVESIEKIEPPVEVFGPGSLVRGRLGYTFAIGKRGYFDVHNGVFREYGSVAQAESFTSEYYERVTVG